jgi:hypothetical protein
METSGFFDPTALPAFASKALFLRERRLRLSVRHATSTLFELGG